MAINFPDSPSNGDTFTANSIVYTYNASTTLWDTISAAGSAIDLSAVNEAIIPDTDVTYDLGSSTYRWKDLYLSGSTLHLGASATISAGSGSEIVLPSIKVGSGSNAVKLSASASGGLQTQAVVGGVTQAVQPAGGTVQVADLAAMQAIANPAIGAMVSVVANKTIYMYNGTGFYKIAVMVNESPSAITGVNGAYALASDSTATTITAIATDPEGRPLTWSYAVSSGALNGTTVVQGPGDSTGPDTNVFTITPHASNSTTFSITFSVTDGVNGAVNAVSTFTLGFIVTNSKYTALSVKATATGSNQTFDDASISNLTISTTGNSSASTFSPYRHGGYATYFDGTGDYLTVPDHADFNMASENFTAECWIYPTASPSQPIIMGQWSGSYSWALEMSNNSSRHLRFLTNAGSIVDNVSSTVVPLNQWSHVALVRNGTSFVAYLNGTSVVSSTVTGALVNSTNALSIGANASGSYAIQGYISNVRVVKGTAVYTSNFTPPTEPLTAITNTKFLIGQLPYFKDQSTSNHTITVAGNASLKPFSLFDNDPYSKADHGASVYFDGTGDYISAEDDASFSFGTGDFTVECWLFHQNASASYYDLIGTASNANYIGANRGGWIFGYYHTHSSTYALKFGYQYNNAFPDDISFSKTLNADTWYHIALTRQGNQLKYFVDGIQVGSTVTNSTNIVSTEPLTIGTGATVTSQYVTGYMSDVRVVKGTAVYTSNFTPPTAPLTAITNTKFLLNPETSISDLSQIGNIKLFGNAATSTTQVKFAGTKSIHFANSGDYLQITNSESWISGYAGNYTIEFWWYPTNIALGTYQEPLTCGTGFQLYTQSNGQVALAIDEANAGSFFWHPQNIYQLVDNTWTHFAIVKNGTAYTIYIDGVSKATTTSSNTIGTSTAILELGSYAGGTYPSPGYYQDFRITKGLARYTANFTPPTAELQG